MSFLVKGNSFFVSYPLYTVANVEYHRSMITLKLEGNLLTVKLQDISKPLFDAAIRALKYNGFQYQNQVWSASPFKYEDILMDLEDIDLIDNQVDQEKLNSFSLAPMEMQMSRPPRVPDYTIMKFPPIKGKAPNEDFQDKAITKGINRTRYAFFYEMGTGKSYIAAAIIAHRLLKYKDCEKVIFLTSAIGVRNLKNELCKFIQGLDPSRIYLATGKDIKPFDSQADIVISSYGTFRRICNYYKAKKKITSRTPRKPFLPLEKWANWKDLMLICDESHEASHCDSQQGYLVQLHSSLFKYRYLFTGTPADKPEKLYNQFRILDPWLTYGLSFSEWKAKMAELGNRFSRTAINKWKKEELEKSNERFLQGHGEYLEAASVIDLPDSFTKRIYLPMSHLHRHIYEKFILSKIPKKGTAQDMVNAFPYLMLGLDNPYLLLKHRDELMDAYPQLESDLRKFGISDMEKFNAMDDILESHPGEKILVWAIHPKTIDMLAEKYSKLNPIVIKGDTDKEERNNLVDQFRFNKENRLLIANITTLSTSVTITECQIQVYFERGFNYTVYEQSTKRIHRLGQTKPTLTYILIYSDSMDVFLDKNLSDKGLLTKKLVDKGFLSQEEWNMIFTCNEDDEF